MKKDPTAVPIYTGVAIIVIISLVFMYLGINIESFKFKSVMGIGIYAVFFYYLLTRKY